MDFQWKPYVPVAERRRKAALEMKKLSKKGHRADPIVIEGRIIAHTFWGKAWCDNLESYSDYSNRLPRGRTYVLNGSVVDLAISSGKVAARVSGSRLYTVAIEVTPLAKPRWKSLRESCAGAIDSVVELLQGRFARGVMERLCHPTTGLFPAPAEIRFKCSCPDWASMCKHVAASLYGIGARLDRTPELFFTLRQVDHADLIAAAVNPLELSNLAPPSSKLLGSDGLSDLFGLDLASPSQSPPPRSRKSPKKAPRKRIKKGKP